ncbi:MAG: nucleotide exchange factor GrpE [Calditrichaeota bacterium]|nr:MAG: nucleotide exchange factor GrpE [Calditrichota bacterium]
MKEKTKTNDVKIKETGNGTEKTKPTAAKKDAKKDAAAKKKYEKELAALKEELEKLNDLNLRRAAEFENFKKRKEREVEEFWKMANVGLIKKLLPVVDDFERSLEAAQKDKNCDSLLQGVELVYKSLKSVFADEGVVEIDALNQPFNPEIHEALMQLEKDGVDSNIVLDQHQKGYMIGENLIRPAQVVVSK